MFLKYPRGNHSARSPVTTTAKGCDRLAAATAAALSATNDTNTVPGVAPGKSVAFVVAKITFPPAAMTRGALLSSAAVIIVIVSPGRSKLAKVGSASVIGTMWVFTPASFDVVFVIVCETRAESTKSAAETMAPRDLDATTIFPTAASVVANRS